MSPRNGFDRFMVDVEIGRNLKVGRLAPAERWTFVAGVLAIAAKAPVRGLLMVGDLPATAEDVARQADVTLAVARKTIEKLEAIRVLEVDRFGIYGVHDFEDYNPPPKHDRTAAERQRRKRDRDSRHAAVTDLSRRDNRDITDVKEEGEETATTSRDRSDADRHLQPIPDGWGMAS